MNEVVANRDISLERGIRTIWEGGMPVFIRYDGMDGQFNEADSFDFMQPTEPSDATVARTNKPSLVVKFDIGGAPSVQDDGLIADEGPGTNKPSLIVKLDIGGPPLSHDDEVLVAFEFGDVHGAAGFTGALHVAVGDVNGDVDVGTFDLM